jgi:hypothetical protein
LGFSWKVNDPFTYQSIDRDGENQGEATSDLEILMHIRTKFLFLFVYVAR